MNATFGHSMTRQIIAGTSICTIILVTVAGNLMVMVAFYRDRRINRKVNNWYIVNMSVADFIVGAFVLVLSVIWTLNDRWPFGETLCKIYLLMDTISVTVPVFTIICISLDRYWLLTKKLDYPKYATKSKAIGFIAFIWIFFVVFYGVETYAWIPITGVQESIDYSWNCELEATYNFQFQIFMIFFTFLFPLVVISVLNIKVYLNIYRRSRRFVQSKPRGSCLKLKQSTSNSPHVTKCAGAFSHSAPHPAAAQNVISPTINAHESVSGRNEIQETVTAPTTSQNGSGSIFGEKTENTIKFEANCSNAKIPSSSISVHTKQNQKKSGFKKSSLETENIEEFNRHRKAAVRLTLFVLVFIVCWLPYYVVALIGAFCEKCVSPPVWFTVSYLLWANSMINPFLYAAMNIYFRANFAKFLGIKKSIRINVIM